MTKLPKKSKKASNKATSKQKKENTEELEVVKLVKSKVKKKDKKKKSKVVNVTPSLKDMKILPTDDSEIAPEKKPTEEPVVKEEPVVEEQISMLVDPPQPSTSEKFLNNVKDLKSSATSKVQNVPIPKLTLPSPTLPKPNLPKLQVPKVGIPKVKLPQGPKVPKISMPKFGVPKIGFPEIKTTFSKRVSLALLTPSSLVFVEAMSGNKVEVDLTPHIKAKELVDERGFVESIKNSLQGFFVKGQKVALVVCKDLLFTFEGSESEFKRKLPFKPDQIATLSLDNKHYSVNKNIPQKLVDTLNSLKIKTEGVFPCDEIVQSGAEPTPESVVDRVNSLKLKSVPRFLDISGTCVPHSIFVKKYEWVYWTIFGVLVFTQIGLSGVLYYQFVQVWESNPEAKKPQTLETLENATYTPKETTESSESSESSAAALTNVDNEDIEGEFVEIAFSDLQYKILNGTGVAGLAGEVSQTLQDEFSVPEESIELDNADNFDNEVTTIQVVRMYEYGDFSELTDVLEDIFTQVEVEVVENADGLDIIIKTGSLAK